MTLEGFSLYALEIHLPSLPLLSTDSIVCASEKCTESAAKNPDGGLTQWQGLSHTVFSVCNRMPTSTIVQGRG